MKYKYDEQEHMLHLIRMCLDFTSQMSGHYRNCLGRILNEDDNDDIEKCIEILKDIRRSLMNKTIKDE